MTPQEEVEARLVIHDFIEWIIWFLDRCINEPDPFPGYTREAKRPLLLPPDAEALRRAWESFRQDWHSESRYLTKIAETPRAQLIEHGLYGPQLAAKMRMVGLQAYAIETYFGDRQPMPGGSVVGRRWFQFASPPVQTADAPRRVKAPAPRGGGFIQGLKNLIARVDVFAESALDAAGIGKALLEIKELFGMSLEE
jgi:hypothetical protein